MSTENEGGGFWSVLFAGVALIAMIGACYAINLVVEAVK